MHATPLATCITIALAAATGFGQSDRTLVHEAVIDAPVAEVWRLFTTSDGAKQWMAPKIEIDLRIGGDIRSSYHPESTLHDEHTIVNHILSYAPMRMLAIQNVQAPAGFSNAELFQTSWSVMRFEPVDDRTTRVRIAGLGYGEGPEWDALYGHFESGNAYLLRLLEKAAQAERAATAADTAGADADAGESDCPMPPVPPAPPAPLTPLIVEATVNAPIGDVWRAWTTSEGVKEFLGVNSNIDLRINGPLELYFGESMPEGQRGSEGCRILAYEPHRMFSFSWNAPPHLPFAREKHTWVVVDFEQVEEGSVRVRLTHLGFEERRIEHPEHAAEFDAARAYFTRGWPSVLAKLKAHFERE